MKLTDRQYEVLAGLRAANENRTLTVESHLLGEMVEQGYISPPLEGASRTMASLVRAGLASKRMIASRAHYGITRDGLGELAKLLTEGDA